MEGARSEPGSVGMLIDGTQDSEWSMNLLSDEALELSGVVANCRMNRERSLTGSNGYSKELGFNPLDLLRSRLRTSRSVNWLDLCCGTGSALIEASQQIASEGLENVVHMDGIDLVDFFSKISPDVHCLQLTAASVTNWEPERHYDLITCIHGLHYVGDKLRLISRATSWLKDDGEFHANLDLDNLKFQGRKLRSQTVSGMLQQQGVIHEARKKRLRCVGSRTIAFPLRYLGADDEAGPNYTGQPAVNSHYELTESR